MRRILAWLMGVVVTGAMTAVTAPLAEAQPLDSSQSETNKMVVIGNSYISGQGAEKDAPIPASSSYEPNTTGPSNYCFRSKYAAVVTVASNLGLKLDFAACAASEPRHVDREIQRLDDGLLVNNELQINHVTADTDIVVMQVIGNPEFAKVVECVQMSFQPGCPEATVAQSIRVIEDQQRFEEQRIYREVKARAPQARIYTLGAPQAVPRVGDDFRHKCGWFMTVTEVSQLNRFIDTVNRVSAQNAALMGATFVDLAQPGSRWNEGHGLCSDEEWMWGPRLAQPQYFPSTFSWEWWLAGSYHPTYYGQLAIAQVLERVIRQQEGSLPGN